MAETRVGYWYATGPADKQYTSGDPDFNLHTVLGGHPKTGHLWSLQNRPLMMA
jgi:hypothetical protein